MNRYTQNRYQSLTAEAAPFKPEALAKVLAEAQPHEDLTPEGIQLVIPGAERITQPTETERQGKLW